MATGVGEIAVRGKLAQKSRFSFLERSETSEKHKIGQFLHSRRGEKASFKLAKTAKALPEALQKHLFHTSNL